jgi:hypothetical protein
MLTFKPGKLLLKNRYQHYQDRGEEYSVVGIEAQGAYLVGIAVSESGQR